MAHLKPGRILPTLLEYHLAGFRHLQVNCRSLGCEYRGRIEIAEYVARRRNLPVDFLRWRCARCGNGIVIIEPVWDTRCQRCSPAPKIVG